jgi:hypothetical protein
MEKRCPLSCTPGWYGSLSGFDFLFADEADQFRDTGTE